MGKRQTGVCTTHDAAELLGMSVSSVQQLVETGVIPGWKTQGGHRRIPLEAVMQLKAATGAPARLGKSSTRSAMLIVEDDPLLQRLYQLRIDQWDLPLDVNFCDSGYQALIDIGRSPPDILVADIMMSGMDGYEVVETVLANPGLGDMHVAIISAIAPAELEKRGGVPPGVVFFSKPVPFEELRGYLRGCCAQKLRTAK
jgi:excisionase family DNA binding protein